MTQQTQDLVAQAAVSFDCIVDQVSPPGSEMFATLRLENQTWGGQQQEIRIPLQPGQYLQPGQHYTFALIAREGETSGHAGYGSQ